jgi:hypothetical protein
MYDQIFVERIEVKSLEAVGYSISGAAKAIGIDRPQLYRYISIARIRIKDYRKAEEVAKKKSPKRPLLCAYQVWALAKIRQLFSEIRDEKRVRALVTANSNLFTLDTFLIEQENAERQTSSGIGHDYRRSELLIA